MGGPAWQDEARSSPPPHGSSSDEHRSACSARSARSTGPDAAEPGAAGPDSEGPGSYDAETDDASGGSGRGSDTEDASSAWAGLRRASEVGSVLEPEGEAEGNSEGEDTLAALPAVQAPAAAPGSALGRPPRPG